MIWLLGSQGMLGSAISRKLTKLKKNFVSSDLELDITKPEALKKFTANKDISVVINCAAYTAVDLAETESQKAYEINGRALENIAQSLTGRDVRIIHISTDYVFNGLQGKPYIESDIPDPQSAYGHSKLAGEKYLKKSTDLYQIIRTSWLYGEQGSHFVATMLKLMNSKLEIKVVNDQFGSPTYSAPFADNLVRLAQQEESPNGIFHYSDSGVISWFEFAVQIQKTAAEFAASA